MKRQWGVEVLFVRQTSAGYMLEFRYKVIDPAKAAPLFERQTKPVLTHVNSGAKFIVPTPAKTRNPRKARRIRTLSRDTPLLSGTIVITRQIIQFTDGDLLITQGPELADVAVPVVRAVTGGTGEYATAPAEIRQTLLGMSDGYGVRL